MILNSFSVIGLTLLAVLGLTLLAAAFWKSSKIKIKEPNSWKSYRFGYITYSLIFLSFDMEMIFMYPWAVVFADIGMKAFLDMFVFIAILSSGIAYSWGMGGLEWE